MGKILEWGEGDEARFDELAIKFAVGDIDAAEKQELDRLERRRNGDHPMITRVTPDSTDAALSRITAEIGRGFDAVDNTPAEIDAIVRKQAAKIDRLSALLREAMAEHDHHQPLCGPVCAWCEKVEEAISNG